MADASTQEALVAAQQALGAGDTEAARAQMDNALGLAETEERKGEVHLSLAEMTWQGGEKSLALEH